MRSVALVSGIIVWLVSLVQSGFRKESFFINRGDYKTASFLFLLFVIVKFVINIIHGREFLACLKSLYINDLQWFWFASVIDFALVKNFFKIKADRILFFTVIFSSFVVSLYIFLQIVGLFPLQQGVYGILSQPFTTSGLLLAGIFVTMISFDYKYLSKPLSVTILGFQLVAIFFLGQVSVWFGLITAMLFLAMKKKWLTFKRVLFIFLILFFACAIAGQVSPRVQAKLNRFSNLEKFFNNKSMQCRYAIWQRNFELVKNKLFLGQGYVESYQCVLGKQTMNLNHAHNIYFQKFFEGGFVEFLVWFVFYMMLGIVLFITRSSIRLKLAAFYIAISFEGFLENWWGDSEVLTLFLFLMVFAVLQNKSLIE